jgi:amidohydrolase
MRSLLIAVLALAGGSRLEAQRAVDAVAREIDVLTSQITPKVVAWRRDIHQHPELGNREVRTSKLVADHLARLGIEVRTGIAKTGVVGVLRGGRPGPVVALRADMDALPVTELVEVPFKSTVRATYNGMDVGVMHACGHDNHVAILMGTAEVLAGLRERVPGTVVFVFQPAEEGPPPGEEGGASLMMKEGALNDPRPAAIFGLHVWPGRVGTIEYRSGSTMAAADWLEIKVKGRQTHGAVPWGGIDPIVVASQIVLGLQTITSRQIDVTKYPAIVTVGMIQGGNRGNIIPDSVMMYGTVRSFEEDMRDDIHARIRRVAEGIAQSAGATVEVTLPRYGQVTSNDPALTERMLPTLRRVVGDDKVNLGQLTTGAEDFPEFTRDRPGLYFFLGVVPEGKDLRAAPRNHSPHFYADEAALPIGVRAMANLAIDYLRQAGAGKAAGRE